MGGQAGLAVFGLTELASAGANIVTGFLSGAAEMERYQTQMTTLMGSADAAKDRLEELAVFGASTPFELPELVRAEKVLQGFGLTGQKAFQMTGMAYEDFFTRVGDISAGVGKPFEEVALTFAKFSSGATGEAISRLQELGIATREQMAGLGVEFSKSGELLSPIPVAMQAVMTLTESKFAGGMQKLSETFEGRLSTLQDSWGGLMRTLGTPLLAFAGPAVQGLSDFIGGPITDLAERVGPKFSEAGERVGAIFERLQPVIQVGRDAVQTFQDALSGNWTANADTVFPLVNSIGLLGTSIREQVLPAWNDFTTWFAGDGGSKIQPFVDTMISLASVALPAVGRGLQLAIETAGPFAAMLISSIRPAMESVGGYISGTLIPAVQGVANFLGPFIQPMLENVGGAFTNLSEQMGPLADTLGPLASAFGELGNALSPVAVLIGGVLVAGLVSAWEVISGLLMGMPTAVKGFVEGVTTVVGGLADIIGGVVGIVTGIIAGDWTGAWNSAGQVVQGAWSVIEGIATAGAGLVLGIITGFVSAGINILSQLVPGARDELQKFKNAFVDAIQSIDVGQMIRQQMNNMIKGITDSLPGIASALAQLRGLFPSSPAKWGPWSSLPDWDSAFNTLAPAIGDATRETLRGLTTLEHDSISMASGLAEGLRNARSSAGDMIGAYTQENGPEALLDGIGPRLTQLLESLNQRIGPSESGVNTALKEIGAPEAPVGSDRTFGSQAPQDAKAQVKTLTLTVPVTFSGNRFGLGPEDNLTPRDIERIVDMVLPSLVVEIAKLMGDEDEE